MKSNIWSRKIRGDRATSSSLPIIVTVILLLLGGGIGMLLAPIIPNVSAGRIGGSILTFGPAFWGLVMGAVSMALIIILREDEFAATVVIAVSIVLDWYLQTYILAPLMALMLLLIFYLTRSPRYPWAKPRALWLWVLFLALIIFAATRGALTSTEALYYYPGITLGAFIMFWLGTVIARNVTSARRFFKALACFGTLMSIHAIIQATTGTFLFWSPLNDGYYAGLSGFIVVAGLDAHRVGSFFLNPDWGGPFFAVMLCITLGLFVESESLLEKFLYLAEVFLMTVALLFSYTYGAWIGACVGIIALLALVGSTRYRVQLSLTLSLFLMVLIIFFSAQLDLLQRRFDPSDSLIRFGAWQTAIRVLGAFPLTGVGLGLYNYLKRAEPYRVPAQYVPLAHPLNSYLELGAGGGLPVLLVFVALLSFALWLAWRNWAQADAQTRALLGGCIAAVIALSIDSFTNNIWTLPPLATLGWLILGVISSPLLMKSRSSEIEREKSNTILHHSSKDRSLYV